MVARSAGAVLLTALLALVLAASAAANEYTNSGNDLRDGWYPESASLNEELLAGGTFGQEWSTNVEGQVYAQPLLYEGTLFVATEANRVYGLEPATGHVQWEKTLPGTPWNPAEIGCADLTPQIGVTSTPVIDPATGIGYLAYKSYVKGSSGAVRWEMDAFHVKTGEQVTGFPVEMAGSAQNAPGQHFDAQDQLQRPGLLLMEGVVYAGFGSDCDHTPYQGWVFGVSTAGAVKARWTTEGETGAEGGGIWQAGAGLTSDGPGTILLATGNGEDPSPPVLGSDPPADLGEAVVRLNVQGNGELKTSDFFMPYDALTLNTWDADFGSGGVTGLPSPYFGTEAVPKLAVVVGKDGYVYLLNREDLGGYGEGSAGEDDVVQRLGPYGGVWSRPGVWPGEGGWVYIPTASGGDSATGSSGNFDVYRYGLSGQNTPSLSLEATSSEAFGFSSSAPIITSNGTESGSALVWVVWAPNGSGEGAQLRAYKATPVEHQPVLLWSAPIGTSSKFALPGVGLGRLYVGTRNGRVLGFGSPVTPVLQGSRTEFPVTTIGETSQRTAKLTANEPLEIEEIASSSQQFEVGAPSIALPASLKSGQSIEAPITFVPDATGPQAATLRVKTSSGKTVSFSLSGEGRAAEAELEANPTSVTLGGTAVGQTLSGTAHFRNIGSKTLKIQGVEDPAPPFYAEAVTRTELAAGEELTVPISFKPTEVGSFEGTLTLRTNVGEAEVHMTGTAALPGLLKIAPETLGFGEAHVGETLTREFTITNTGGLPDKVNISKPPVNNAFRAETALGEGTVIAPGEKLTEKVSFTPTAADAYEDEWRIAGEDAGGLHQVRFSGTGTPALPGKLEIKPQQLEFGDVAVGKSATRAFAIENTGGESDAVQLSEPPASDGFHAKTTLAKGTVLEPGETITEEVSFAPTGKGTATGSWKIEGADGGGAHVVSLSGTGETPGLLSVEPTTLAFGDVAVGGEDVRSFTISNSGELPDTVKKSEPPESGAFHAVSSLADGTVVAPGETLTESVRFAPSSAAGAEGVWEIEGEDAGGLQHVDLLGTGTPAPGVLAVQPQQLEFGEVPVGAERALSFTVENTGGSPDTVRISEPPASAGFRADTGLPAGTTIEPGKSVIAIVTFAPTVAGAATGDWRIEGADSSGPQLVGLAGTGTGGLISPGPGSGVLGTITAETPPDAELASAAVTASAAGYVTLKVSCAHGETVCAGTVTLRSLQALLVRGSSRPAIVTAGSATFKVAVGHVVSVRLRLSRAVRSLLARHRSLRLRAVVTAHDADGTAHTTHQILTVRAPR